MSAEKVTPLFTHIPDSLKLPPQNIEVEEALIGGILLDPNAMSRVVDRLHPDAFYLKPLRDAYKACLTLYRSDRPTDLLAVMSQLQKQKLVKEETQAYLMRLLDTTVSSVNVDFYADLVQEKYQKRRTIEIYSRAIEQLYEKSSELPEILNTVEREVNAVHLERETKGLIPVSDIQVDELARLQSLSEGETVAGTPTEFYDLDACTGGVKPGDLIVIAGRPSMGKSAFVGAIARSVAGRGEPTAIFSLEMSGGQIVRRMWAAEAGIDSAVLANGKIPPHEIDKLYGAIAVINDLPLHIDEGQSVTLPHIRTECRKLRQRAGKVGLVVIDYLHLMLDGEDENQNAEIGRITRGCKKLARELNAPVILLSQLSRGVEGRNNKRPMMSDLRQSGCIEQDADLILMLYRDEYYNPNTPDRGIAEVIISKNRGGPTGTVKLLFEPVFTRFRNLRRAGQ